MNETNERKQFIITGAERSGKTYFTEKLLSGEAAKGAMCIVYNPGRESDFSDYVNFEIKDFNERYLSADRKARRRLKLSNRGDILSCIESGSDLDVPVKALNLLAQSGRLNKIKVRRTGDSNAENDFFRAVGLYCRNARLVIDDARPFFRHGLTAKLIELMSRKAHTGYKLPEKLRAGRGTGTDIFVLSHNISKVSPETFDYTTGVVMFRQRSKPVFSASIDDFVSDAAEQIHEQLPNFPRYSFGFIDVLNQNFKIYKPI